jgi:glycerophosphoryl diester phosphodiesterase
MATHPENTIPAFLHAIACGADGVELDIVPTPDNTLWVTHDPVFNLPLPTLDEVLSLAAPDTFWFDIEAKSVPGVTPAALPYARLLSEAIRRSSCRHRILVRSFDHTILRAFHELEPDIPLSALIDHDSADWVAIARAAFATAISPHYSTVTAERVAQAHSARIGVSVWTVNDPGDWARLAAMGVDAIITDDPAAAVDYFRYFFKSG